MDYFIKPDGRITKDYTKGYDEYLSPLSTDGILLPNHKNLHLVADITQKYYLQTIDAISGKYEPDVAKNTAEATDTLLATYNGFVDKLIADEVILFNSTNGTAFTHVDGFAKYTTNQAYTIYAVCSDFVLWVDTVWAKVREIKASVLLGTKLNATWTDVIPTEAEFLAELPVRV